MAEIRLELTPKTRFDIIDVTKHIELHHDNFFAEYDKAIYCSYHTTAGYLEQSLCAKLEHNSDSVKNFLHPFQELFPPRANYTHDMMHLRSELTEEQKLVEPLNGDSHLTYISSGLENCVTYQNTPNTPVYFIDLDGVCDGRARQRKTTVFGYNKEELVGIVPLAIPVSGHRIDSVNLRDPRLGIFEQLEEQVRRHGIERGRIEIVLAPEEEILPEAKITVPTGPTLDDLLVKAQKHGVSRAQVATAARYYCKVNDVDRLNQEQIRDLYDRMVARYGKDQPQNGYGAESNIAEAVNGHRSH